MIQKLTTALMVVGLFTTVGGAALGAEPVADPIPAKIEAAKTGVKLEPVAEGMVGPIYLTALNDGSGRLFVVDQPGQVWLIRDGKREAEPYLDVKPYLVELRPGFDERGLIGFAFHPDFAKKDAAGYGRLYTWTSEPIAEGEPHFDLQLEGDAKLDSQMVLSEFRVDDAKADTVDAGQRRVLMRIDDPAFNHNGAPIAFDKAGLLYIPIGDGGAGNDMGPGHSPQGNGQDLNKAFAKVLRIDPLGKTGDKPYGIPSDNPLVGKDGLDEIYAWGVRNPWGMAYDAETGRMVFADVGQAKVEEVNVLKPGNFGWPIKEGTFYFFRSGANLGQVSAEPNSEEGKGAFIDPAVQYDHDEGISITGGAVYRGKSMPQHIGKYIFGDWKHPNKDIKSGRLFVADLETGVIQELLVDGKLPGRFVRGFGVDADGEIYLLSSTSVGPSGKSGTVHRITSGD